MVGFRRGEDLNDSLVLVRCFRTLQIPRQDRAYRSNGNRSPGVIESRESLTAAVRVSPESQDLRAAVTLSFPESKCRSHLEKLKKLVFSRFNSTP
jgi:hypothetical protein